MSEESLILPALVGPLENPLSQELNQTPIVAQRPKDLFFKLLQAETAEQPSLPHDLQPTMESVPLNQNQSKPGLPGSVGLPLTDLGGNLLPPDGKEVPSRNLESMFRNMPTEIPNVEARSQAVEKQAISPIPSSDIQDTEVKTGVELNWLKQRELPESFSRITPRQEHVSRGPPPEYNTPVGQNINVNDEQVEKNLVASSNREGHELRSLNDVVRTERSESDGHPKIKLGPLIINGVAENRSQLSSPPNSLPQQHVIQHHIRDSQWPAEFNHKIVTLVKQGLQHAELRINPPHLGQIEVKINLHNDQAQIQFTSPHQVVREVIESSLFRLREQLAEAGIQLGHSQVAQQQSGERRGYCPAEEYHVREGEATQSLESHTIVLVHPSGYLDVFA